MADTATTASAAAASAANTSTDAPPFQLGKPRFQQVRAGLRSEGRRVAQGGRANSSPKPPLVPGSLTRGHRGAGSYCLGDLGYSRPSPIGEREGRGLPPRLPIGRPRRHSPAARALQPCPPEALGDWPLRVAAGARGRPGPSGCCRVALGCAARRSRRKVRPRPRRTTWRDRDAFQLSLGGGWHSCEPLRSSPGSARCTPRSCSQPSTPRRARSARRFRAPGRGHPAARRPLSLPAGGSLTQRVGRQVPAGMERGCAGRGGCGGNAVSSSGATGCGESPRTRVPPPPPRRPLPRGSRHPGPGAAERAAPSGPAGLCGPG